MLLSPLASPNTFKASLPRPLPPLHDYPNDNDDNDIDNDEEGSDASDTDSDKFEFEFEFDDDGDSTSDSDDDDGSSAVEFFCAQRSCTSYPAEAVTFIMDADTVQLQLALPVELILTVIELASSSHLKTALVLCRVSSWVRAAVLPSLYRVMLLHEDREKPAVTPNPSLLPPPAPPLNTLPYKSVLQYSMEEQIDEDSNFNDARDGRNGKVADALEHVRSLWVDVPPERAPHSLDAFPNLIQLALPLEAHATICNSRKLLRKWEEEEDAKRGAVSPASELPNVLKLNGDEDGGSGAAGGDKGCSDGVAESESESEPQTGEDQPSEFNMAGDDFSSFCFDSEYEEEAESTCRSFTVLGQSHPHRWAPLTSSPQGQAFLREVTHLRLLNLCLSHYIPLDFTPSLTHLCLPFFDLRSDEPLHLALQHNANPDPHDAPNPTSPFAPLDPILSSPSIPNLQMLVLTLNPRYWRFDERSLKGWALGAMARDPRMFVIAETREDATRDWECARRDWEEEARTACGTGSGSNYGCGSGGDVQRVKRTIREAAGAGAEEMGGVWAKAVEVRRKFLARASKSFN